MLAGSYFHEVFSSFSAIFPRASLAVAIAALKSPDYVRQNFERGIVVADVLGQLRPRYIRVGIGILEENNFFLASMKEILSISF